MNYRKADQASLTWALYLLKSAASEYLDATLSLMHLSIETFAQLFVQTGEIVIVELDQEDIGFYWVEKRDDVMHIHGLIIDHPFQGKGYGKKIMLHIEKTLPKTVTTLELGVKMDNTIAIGLYRKLGYTITQHLDDVGFYIMKKDL